MTVTVLDGTWELEVWPANPEQAPNAVYIKVQHKPRYGQESSLPGGIRFGLTSPDVNRIAYALIQASTNYRAVEVHQAFQERAERELIARTEPESRSVPATKPATAAADVPFTKTQGRYLAFIHRYISRFGRAPSESDIQRHFLVSAPSVNAMMQTLTRKGLISRVPGVPRSIKLLVPPDLLPAS